MISGARLRSQGLVDSRRSNRSWIPKSQAIEYTPVRSKLVDGHATLRWHVEPGNVLALHYRTLHGAPGNSLSIRRRAGSLRWLGHNARFGVRPWATSPPFEPNGLVEGGSLRDDPRFQLVTN